MYGERHRVSITTAADGSATGHTPVVTGRILSILYTKTDFADGSTMTVTGETTGVAIWSETGVNASAARHPRTQVHDSAGAALTFDGTRKVCEPIMVVQERVKIVIAGGGDAKTGVFTVIVG